MSVSKHIDYFIKSFYVYSLYIVRKLLGNTVKQRKRPFWTVPVSEDNICDQEEDFKAKSKATMAHIKT